jgi:hypothetical protein
MGVERGDLSLNRAAAGVAALGVGCRHDGYDWFRLMLDWGTRPQVMSHGNWKSSQSARDRYEQARKLCNSRVTFSSIDRDTKVRSRGKSSRMRGRR